MRQYDANQDLTDSFKVVDSAKVVYLDVDTMVTRNIDHLFDLNYDFAGVEDLGGVINTGVLQIKPSIKTFAKMMQIYLTSPSYNGGDQGFLNHFFKNEGKYHVGELSAELNVPGKLKVGLRVHSATFQADAPVNLQSYSIGKKLIANASVFHYTAETKPCEQPVHRREGHSDVTGPFYRWSYYHFTHKDHAV